MNGILTIEAIGDDLYKKAKSLGHLFRVPPRFWVAEITGYDSKYCFKRNFLRGQYDYENSNSVGSRGVLVHFTLEPNRAYEVKRPMSWRSDERFFCSCGTDGKIKKIDEEGVKRLISFNDFMRVKCQKNS